MVLINLTKNTVISERVEIARNFFKRALGLMFLEKYDGALVFPLHGRASFHTFFCRFPILFLCVKEGRVQCKKVVPPWRFLTLEGDYVVELDGRREYPVEVGDRVELSEDSGR